jgi:arylsulfatase
MLMSPKPQNVILLSIDALRADHLSCNGYHRETTPNIDRIAADNLQFTNAFSPSSHTREAVPALLTGRYPDEAVDGGYHLDADTVAAQFRNRGYTTGAFHSNPFLSRAYDYDMDFDKFDDDLHISQHRLIVLAQRVIDKLQNRHYARADTINKRSLKWIDLLARTRSPFFLWNHYMDVHGPYEPPERYQELYRHEAVSRRAAQKLYKRAIDAPESITGAERQTLIDLYDAEIRYIDDRLGSFLSELSERELLNESLIIITSDHGDGFGEHGYYEHPRRLDTELVHVPLVISHPTLAHNQHTEAVSTLDIVPTIHDAFSFSMASESYPGESLLQILDGLNEHTSRLVFSQTSGEGNESTLRRFAARSTTDAHTIELDINSKEVPREDDEVEGDRRAINSLYKHVRERLSAGSLSRSSGNSSANSEVEERLRALGYRE